MGLGSVVSTYEVVLATWNGSTYLQQQLDSILGQTQPPVRLLIADDGSSDHTLAVIRAWHQRTRFPMRVLPPVPERLGSCRTFERLLVASTADYVMLSDQDDVWDSDKAERLLAAMLDLEKCYGRQLPLLVHSDLRLINAHGEPLATSFIRYQHLDPEKDHWLEIAMQNVVTGCACLLNRACARDSLPFPPEAVLHDWWLALVAARCGAIGYLPQPSVSYRQHSSNLVGAKGLYAQYRRRLSQLLEQNPLELWIGPGLRQLQACQRRFPTANPRKVCALSRLSSSSTWRRFCAALWLRLKKHGVLRTLGFYLALLCVQSRRL